VNVKNIDSLKEKAQKELVIAEEEGVKVALNIALSEELKQEGWARDLVRFVQVARKKAGLAVSDRIDLFLETKDPKLEKTIDQWQDYIQKETLTKTLVRKRGNVDYSSEGKVEKKEVWLGLKKA